jgi:hypothetical protein
VAQPYPLSLPKSDEKILGEDLTIGSSIFGEGGKTLAAFVMTISDLAA